MHWVHHSVPRSGTTGGATKVAVPREVVILVAYFTRHPQGVVPGELWS